jgi:N-acetylglucosamine-6-phosphate deacetylase
LPSTFTADKDRLSDVCQIVHRAYIKQQKENNLEPSAKIQGMFFEGPFFTSKHRGAQNSLYFLDPSVKLFSEWQEKSGNLIKKIALAPERKGTIDFVKEITKTGVIVSLGHSNATYSQAMDAVFAGATIFNHVDNCMSPLSHREPGMVGAALNSIGTFAEVICDGYHLNAAATDIVFKMKGSSHTMLISDCMQAGGMPDGNYTLGEFDVVVKDGTARLQDSGNLAGSILKLSDAVKNVVSWGIAKKKAIKMGSYTPSKSVGIESKCGSIVSQHSADFIVLSKDFSLQETYLDGNLVYKAT